MGRITIASLDERQLSTAARLLADRQRRLRAADPWLPAAFESPDVCLPLIQRELAEPGAIGVVALAGSAPVGFMIMAPIVFSPMEMRAAFLPVRPAEVSYFAHAADEGWVFGSYREMYGSLAERFVAGGYFDHMAYISPHDPAEQEAFVSLSFGRSLVAALRNVDPIDGASASIDVHLASPEDASVVDALNGELLAHHARSPIFWPHAKEPVAALEAFQHTLLDAPQENAHFVAYDGKTPLGMNTFMAPEWINAMCRPEKTVYLYQGIVSAEARSGGVGKAILARGIDWAREQGFEHIGLHYAAPNISGALFWETQGFRAVEYRMTRRVDDRIAWAGSP